MSRRFILAAGGTGGHLFPAEALAGELLNRGDEVHFVSDARADAFAGHFPGIATHVVCAGRIGGGPAHAVRAVGEMALGVLQARRLLRRLLPAGVVGFGGYPSVATMLAAVYLGLPTMIHEQNAVLGRANRLLAPRVGRIATGFPWVAGLRPGDRARTVCIGNPVRSEVLAVGQPSYKAPQRGGPIGLLILGGSQGARIMSEVVPPALAALPARFREMLRVSHQARPEDLPAAESIYRENRIAAELQTFFTDVPERLVRAHLVICRSGASTIAEIAAIGRPALLVPYPHATDDHQTANARAFAEAGGGWVVPQPELHPDTLALHLETLLGDTTALAAAAQHARDFGRRDAAQELMRLVLELEPRAGLGSRPQGRAA